MSEQVYKIEEVEGTLVISSQFSIIIPVETVSGIDPAIAAASISETVLERVALDINEDGRRQIKEYLEARNV